MKRPLIAAIVAVAAVAGAMMIPTRPSAATSTPTVTATPLSLEGYASDKPEKPLDILFIHHSCGGQLLADAASSEKGDHCIYDTHPSGGGLRAMLTGQGYRVHEASYGSDIGEDTDMFHWVGKFGTKMDKILGLAHQDEALPSGQKNSVVVFKSCFPNNQFVGEGTAPGNAAGPDLTVWNARASLTALLPMFEKHPDTLFIYMTAPAVAPVPEKMRLYRVVVRALKGRSEPEWTAKQASWARQFNTWAASTDGWLKDYPGKNVVVFDYYDILTGHGKSNLSVYATEEGADSHPSSKGNKEAAEAFVPFLNKAIRRAGLLPPPKAADATN